ncbi:hypothetical protein DACRYDRAFT_113123 [Dacryopinax primogenitus]|uniref:Zn(2)-C6 fungal-type domain-containing protein n=1 Tax=Dacryopinax primogenitus (strain DJM 731) TaxID=1858805 RepID=M5GFK9_DACPD|nr:uncharacterized protein DACRYDRAFT_113123 [Dacryopinax primogenitus]EJU06412.1 hypothetical protein DACRYDRAFT_113123 [Dacryopinax primogenitus]
MASDQNSTKSLRKRRRACDACHKRKVRCDGIQQGQTACTYCLKSNRECTFESTPRKWPPSKNYVGGLEARVEHLERLLANIAPWPSSGHALPWDDAGNSAESPDEDDISEDDNRNEFFTNMRLRGFGELRIADEDDGSGRPVSGGPSKDFYPPQFERKLHEPRFFHGKTSHFMVVRQLNELLATRAPEERRLFHIRPEFTRVHPNSYFEESDVSEMNVQWPEPDLADQLIQGFFDKFNAGFPILHRPTFLRQWADPANHTKREWAALAFAVFACGAKTIDDPRTKAWPNDKYKHSAGLPYWYEMRRIAYPPYAPPTLCRLQTTVLGGLAIMGTPITPSAAWGLIGLASRLAQDAGIHRRSARRQRADPFEYEMRKRVFWAAYFMDRTMASFLDRPLAFREEDYDVELPLELDDEQLDNLQYGRKVEEGEGCLHLAAWVYRLRLLQICSRALSTLYAARNTQRPDLAEWERVILINLSSALNSLSEMQPEKLKFDPENPDDTVFLHTALVNIQYQLTQILVYRPFLHPAKLALHEDVPSSAVCSGAARALAHTISGLYTRDLLNGRTLETGLSSFSAGTLLLMDMWQRQEADSIVEVEKCLEALTYLEQTWQMGGMVRDILTGLLQLTKTAMYRSSGKRRKTGDNAGSAGFAAGGSVPRGPSIASSTSLSSGPSMTDVSSTLSTPAYPPATLQPALQPIVHSIQQPLAPMFPKSTQVSFDTTALPHQQLFDPIVPMPLDASQEQGPDFLTQIFASTTVPVTSDPAAEQYSLLGDEMFDANFTEWLSAMLGASQHATPPDATASSGGSDTFSPPPGSGPTPGPATATTVDQMNTDGVQNMFLNTYQGNYGLY